MRTLNLSSSTIFFKIGKKLVKESGPTFYANLLMAFATPYLTSLCSSAANSIKIGCNFWVATSFVTNPLIIVITSVKLALTVCTESLLRYWKCGIMMLNFSAEIVFTNLIRLTIATARTSFSGSRSKLVKIWIKEASEASLPNASESCFFERKVN